MLLSNYAGPGTKIVDQIKKNIKPVDNVDSISQIHDVAYYYSKNKNEIRKADRNFVHQALNNISQDLSFSHPL